MQSLNKINISYKNSLKVNYFYVNLTTGIVLTSIFISIQSSWLKMLLQNTGLEIVVSCISELLSAPGSPLFPNSHIFLRVISLSLAVSLALCCHSMLSKLLSASS